jgi:copper chaperone CopZ
LPAGISLYKNGASKGSSVSFLISTPQTGLDSIFVTWSMLGLPFALLRPVAAFITGITGGVVTNELEKQNNKEDKNQPAETHAMRPKRSVKTVIHYAFVEMVMDIAKWLVIGLLIAALISVLIPDNFFTDFKMNGLLGMLVILVVSIPLYICATSSVPIAAVLLLKGISPGALLVFLMAGPATNAATMTVIGKNMGRKTLTIYLASLIAGALLFGLVIDYLLPGNWFSPLALMEGGHVHQLLPEWLKYGSAVIMTLLLIYSFYTRIIEKIKSKSKMKQTSEFSLDIPEMVIGVEGMTCAHCKARVENGLRSQTNVTNAIADIENNTVKLYGDHLDPEKMEKTISELGYVYKGKTR